MTYHEESVELPLELCTPHRVECPKGSGSFMRLSDDPRNCVVYLGQGIPNTESEIDPKGTGFLVHMGVPGGTYLVTAGHVALDHLTGCSFDVRLNQKKPNPARLFHYDSARWFYHPTDETVDIAVMPFDLPEWAETTWFQYRHFLSDFKLGMKRIGAGDFTYTVGVLHFMHGKTRNMPAVHTGHVVLMPDDEPIPITNWRNATNPRMHIDAYLVQSSALPGSSGAPVFTRRTLDTRLLIPTIDKNPLVVSLVGSLWLLGVWRGAWFGEATDALRLPRSVQGMKVPVAMGTVVPAIRLAEILNCAELVKMREQAQIEHDLSRAPEATGLPKRNRGDDILRAALNTPPSPQKKSKAKAAKKRRAGVSSK